MATNSNVSLSISIDREKILGKGAYGIVYEGTWMNRKVAVKRIQIENVENNKGGEEPLLELDHPNVVKLYHVEIDPNFRFYALELCQLPLNQLFHGDEAQKKYREKMPPENEVCLQLAKGLAYIHQKRFIHRDIKPHNVLIWVDCGQKKVVMKWADFGLSKRVNERGSHSISGVKGTNYWHSPEIVKIMMEENDRKTTTTTPSIRPRGTVKSDVFTAGLVFGYYLLGGDHPFGSPINIQANILKNEPVNLPKIKEHLMHAIIMEMLKANPNERISSADVVLRIKFFTVQKNHYDNRVEYKKIERSLTEAYEKSFKKVKQEMIKSTEERKNSVPFYYFEDKLHNEVHLAVEELDKMLDDVVNKKGQEKWQLQFQIMWDRNKNDQEFNWRLKLKNAYDRLFNYEKRVEEYKKKMRQEINAFFKSPKNSKVTDWEPSEKNKKFEEMFDKILDEAKKEFPTTDVQREIKQVYQNSSVIKKRYIEIDWTDQLLMVAYLPVGKNKEDKKSTWDFIKRKFSFLFYGNGNEKEKEKQNSIIKCADSVNDAVNRIATGTLCYDNSIVSHIIREIDSKLCEYHLTDHSVVQSMFQYGMELTVNLMKTIQDQWEQENSVPAKLESNKENLRIKFVLVSKGAAKTKLFAYHMADILEEQIIPAFENEMVQRTFQGIRNERWLYDARFMQKHMDLHLIDLLESNQLDQVLDYIGNPQRLYADVLHILIAQKVSNIDDEWETFENHLRDAIDKAAAVKVEKERAQTFVDQLRKEFLYGYFQSESLHSAFRIDCSGEYEDCDNEGKKEFQDACLDKFIQVLIMQKIIIDIKDYSKQLSSKVVQHMKKVNDKAALLRCDAFCHMCKSLCIEAANHDIQDRPHDTVHQPGGVTGQSYMHTDELVHRTCHQSYQEDRTFNLDYTVAYYRDYAKVFPGWKDPRINENSPLCEYILATYNKEIAKKYNVKPSTKIPSSYSSRTLSSMKEQLQSEIAEHFVE